MYMVDVLQREKRDHDEFAEQIGPDIQHGSLPLAYAEWANPATENGVVDTIHYEVTDKAVSEGWKIVQDFSIRPTTLHGSTPNDSP